MSFLKFGVALTVTLALVLPAQAAAAASRPAAVSPAVVRVCPPPSAGQASCLAEAAVTAHPSALSSPPETGLTPEDIQEAYNLTDVSGGKNQTVAVIDAYYTPHAESDLAAYRDYFGLPACTKANGCLHIYNQNGSTTPLPTNQNSDWAGEVSLDLDAVSAICPNCHIDLMEANSQSEDDLGAAGLAVTRMLGVHYESNSWGYILPSKGPAWYDEHFLSTSLLVTASTGDDGYIVDSAGGGVLWPAADAGVIAVGGTSLLRAGNARGWDEVAWTGTGSGCAVVVAKPSWQQDTGCTHRSLSDLSAAADPYAGGLDVVMDGDWWVIGGTSESSPLIAAMLALAGDTPGENAIQRMYGKAARFNDIVAGRNYFKSCTPTYICVAGPGYDGPTGLGTPNGLGVFASS